MKKGIVIYRLHQVDVGFKQLSLIAVSYNKYKWRRMF